MELQFILEDDALSGADVNDSLSGSDIENDDPLDGVDVLNSDQESELGESEEDFATEYLIDLTTLLLDAFRLKASDEVIALTYSKKWRVYPPHKKIAWIRNLIEKNRDELVNESVFDKRLKLAENYYGIIKEEDDVPDFGGESSIDNLEGVDDSLQGDILSLIVRALKEDPYIHTHDVLKKLPSSVNESNYELVMQTIESVV